MNSREEESSGEKEEIFTDDFTHGESLRQNNHVKEANGKTAVKESNTLFTDGMADQITYQKVKELFARVGSAEGIFIQRREKENRNSKFGFVRYNKISYAKEAIKKING